MDESRPEVGAYPDTPEGRHAWAQAMQWWNDLMGVTSDDLISKWNEERKRA